MRIIKNLPNLTMIVILLVFKSTAEQDVEAFQWKIDQMLPSLSCDQHACNENTCNARCLPSSKDSFPPPNIHLIDDAMSKIVGFQFKNYINKISIINSEIQPTLYGRYWRIECFPSRDDQRVEFSFWTILLYCYTFCSFCYWTYTIYRVVRNSSFVHQLYAKIWNYELIPSREHRSPSNDTSVDVQSAREAEQSSCNPEFERIELRVVENYLN